MHDLLRAEHTLLGQMELREISGTVAATRGLTLEVADLPLPVGSLVRIETGRPGDDASTVRGEVIAFDGARSRVMVHGGGQGIAPGHRVIGEQTAQTIRVGRCLLGQVVDAYGRPLTRAGANSHDLIPRPLHRAPRPARLRCRVWMLSRTRRQ